MADYKTCLAMADKLVSENDCTLLYLTMFGSQLYGTSTGSSDVDIRGIFLPSQKSLVLQDAKHSLHYSTGDDESRNTSDDVDIDLWSLQHWLFKLLPAGDTGAMDVFFSPSNTECVLYRSPLLDTVFASPEKLLNLAGGHAYAAYALGQARKYGIKGSRLGAIRQVHHWVHANTGEDRFGMKLGDILDELAAACADGKYCSVVTLHTGETALQLCGKFHITGISLEEFTRRLDSDMSRYGTRAEQADRNEGVDCKAISHALRALDQMDELLRTGTVVFPLKTRKEIMKVKQGSFTWQEMEPMVLKRLAEIDTLREQSSLPHAYDADFAREQVLAAYGFAVSRLPVEAPDVSVRSLSEDVCRDIHNRLAEVEKTHNVRILYACESGSRAWGFPSMDSDYDIRFIYAHDEDWYLDIRQDKKDVIELGVIRTDHGVLDINGWDLRKAFQLLVKSNAQILEWLDSPTVILDRFATGQEMRQLAEKGFDYPAVWYHYSKFLHNSRRAYRNKPNSKRFLYMLRSLLCLLWLESNQTLPPMSIYRLLPGVRAVQSYQEDIMEIIRDREESDDHSAFRLPDRLRRWIVDEIERLEQVKPSGPAHERRTGFGAAFRRILRLSWT